MPGLLHIDHFLMQAHIFWWHVKTCRKVRTISFMDNQIKYMGKMNLAALI